MATDLIFDFFGTLVLYKSGPFHTAPYARTYDYLLKQGFALTYEDFTTAFESASSLLEARAQQGGQEYHMEELGQVFFRLALEREVSEAILHRFITLFLEEWGRGIVYLEALDPFLKRLTTNYRLSVLSNTNYPPLIHDHLAAMGVAHHFAQVVTSVEVGVRKPHLPIFQHTLEQLQITAREAIYVGDTYLADYQGATAAGMRCVLIAPPGQYLDVLERIETLFALEPYLQATQKLR